VQHAQNPERGKAQGRIDRDRCHRARVRPASRETDRSRETPRSQHRIRPRPFAQLSLTLNFKPATWANSTKINRVGRRDEKACGSGGSEMRSQPCAGMNLRRDEPHERRRASRGKDHSHRPGREGPQRRVAERRAYGKATAHDPIRTAETLRRRSQDRVAIERANRFPRFALAAAIEDVTARASGVYSSRPSWGRSR
jgi:hypothetical protein